jgi:hypothetical protein
VQKGFKQEEERSCATSPDWLQSKPAIGPSRFIGFPKRVSPEAE